LGRLPGRGHRAAAGEDPVDGGPRQGLAVVVGSGASRWCPRRAHYRLTVPVGRPGADVETLSWLDDHSRYAPHVSAHRRITGPIVLHVFRQAAEPHGYPAATLTDIGMVSTIRFAGGRGGRTAFEHELRRLDVVQKNSRPGHPTTCGKVEHFQQTLKNWLAAQPDQPATIDQLQALLDVFLTACNYHRPHRSLPHRATPATDYTARPKATPGTGRAAGTHDRVRTDKIDQSGCVAVRLAGRLHHLGVGRTHTGTGVLLLVQDLHVRVVHAATGELLRELTIDPTRDHQPNGRSPGPSRTEQ
jgi:transposase InsO family protein